MSTHQDFIQQLKTSFPGLSSQPLDSLVSENLVSSFTVQLPAAVLGKIQKAISVLFNLRENKIYQDSYQTEIAALGLKDPGNKSICMSYDFHVTHDNQIKLIEVNTNASFLVLGQELYKSRGLPLPVKDFSYQKLQQAIETEMQLNGKKPHHPLVATIIDENPEQQRLYIEFLAYQELFRQWGWDVKIQDFRKVVPADTDFIYNRHTDFYLHQPESAVLKKAFVEKVSCFSPNPYEYFLLADKQRMIEWSDDANLKRWQVSAADQAEIRAAVPLSTSLEVANKEEIWAQRKNLFFKPKRAFGSKQSYRGSSVSRKVFEEIVGHEFIAQEFVPPTEQIFETPEGPVNFKFDLRCYAYQGTLQLIVARLYQGQVTNLRTPYGGFACVEFDN